MSLNINQRLGNDSLNYKVVFYPGISENRTSFKVYTDTFHLPTYILVTDKFIL